MVDKSLFVGERPQESFTRRSCTDSDKTGRPLGETLGSRGLRTKIEMTLLSLGTKSMNGIYIFCGGCGTMAVGQGERW